MLAWIEKGAQLFYSTRDRYWLYCKKVNYMRLREKSITDIVNSISTFITPAMPLTPARVHDVECQLISGKLSRGNCSF